MNATTPAGRVSPTGPTGSTGSADGPAADSTDAGIADGVVPDTRGSRADADADVSAGCQTCELASQSNNCSPLLLTATFTLDAQTGDQIAVGWGIDTLPSQSQRDAALDLFRCISDHACATNSTNTGVGGNPALGCLGGVGTDPTAIVAGTFKGPCIVQYKAAAVADRLNAAGDSDAHFGLAIAQAAFDPTLAVGLADTLAQCALEAPCPLCSGL